MTESNYMSFYFNFDWSSFWEILKNSIGNEKHLIEKMTQKTSRISAEIGKAKESKKYS